MKKLNIVSYNEALDKAVNLLKKENPKELISIFSSLGRVFAETITCKKDLPAFNNSAMDGFAIKFSEKGQKLKIKDTIYAGKTLDPCLEANECYKIMTGAQVPNDVDTIIPFENCIDYNDQFVNIGDNIKKGNALRLKGEEQSYGEVIFEKGEEITSSSIAMLASQGITTISVYKKLSIAIFSTGDELKEPWDNANDNEIYNVNSSALLSLLQEHGFNADYCGVIPDNLKESIEYFSKMKNYDAIITTGGISMGEADFIEEALKANGLKEAFHGINIKPGKPTMMGTMENTLVASMPGNPLAAYVNAFLFLIPALKNIQGFKQVFHKSLIVKNRKTINVKSGRVNILLGSIVDGEFEVFGDNKYGSGMILPIIGSNAISLTSENDKTINENNKIKIILF